MPHARSINGAPLFGLMIYSWAGSIDLMEFKESESPMVMQKTDLEQ